MISTTECCGYRVKGHPEQPERVRIPLELFHKKGYPIQPPVPATVQEISRVHEQILIERLAKGSFHDPETPYVPKIEGFARLSAGGATTAMRSVLSGSPAFSLMRPPGHHAGRSSMGGFCYINNIAVAVMEALSKVKRVGIVDIDVHHGNGTQDIFLGHSDVIFASLHQVPLYPGTGLTSERNCLNLPLQAGTGENEYLRVLDQALEQILSFKPEILAISAGFDTYRYDPLAGLGLDIETYKKIGQRFASTGLPMFGVLEGGYSPDLASCIENFLEGFF